MTTPQDPRRQPLQDDEVELARVLRALPAGEPSAKLDAAILAAASDAVAASGATPPRRRVRSAWALPTWAIGTAAAAVLAVGVGVQLMPPPSSSTADRAQTPAAPASARTEAADRLDVEIVERRREIPPTYPPPPARKVEPHPAPAPDLAPPPPPAPPAVAAPEPQAFPAPAAPRDAGAFAPPPAGIGEADATARTGGRADDGSRLRQSPSELNRIDAERRERARRLEQLAAAREEQAEAARAQSQLADAPRDDADTAALGASAARDAAAPAQPAASEAMAAEADAFAETAPVVTAPPAAATPSSPATADAAAKLPPLPPVAEDARLAPAAWLDRIRARWRAGDRDGARASLATLRERHPQLAIPDDLQPLLR